MIAGMLRTWGRRILTVVTAASLLLMIVAPVSAKQLELARNDASAGVTWSAPSSADRTAPSNALRLSQNGCPRGRLMCTNSRFQQWCIPARCSCGQYPGTWVCQRMF